MLGTLAFCRERRGAGLASWLLWPWCPPWGQRWDSWPACQLAHWVGGTTGDCGQLGAATQTLEPGGVAWTLALLSGGHTC